jgi:hypothetical protein
MGTTVKFAKGIDSTHAFSYGIAGIQTAAMPLKVHSNQISRKHPLIPVGFLLLLQYELEFVIAAFNRHTVTPSFGYNNIGIAPAGFYKTFVHGFDGS